MEVSREFGSDPAQAARIHHSAPHSDKMPGPGLHSYNQHPHLWGKLSAFILMNAALSSECTFLIKLQSS